MTPANRNDDRRVRQLAVKNLLHEAAARTERVPELLQELYRDASSCRLEEDAELLAGPFAQTSRHVFSPPNTAFRDPCPCPGGGFLGVEVYGQRLMRLGFDSGLQPVCAPFGASAITSTKEGFAVLSAPDQQLFLLDENLAPLSCCAAQELGIVLNQSTWITEVGDGLAIAVAETREVLFVSKQLRVTGKVRLPRSSSPGSMVGYGGGVLVSEAIPSDSRCGGLLWVHEDGAVRSVMEGLGRPMGLSVASWGWVVCSFSGIHFLRTQGLAVTGHQLLPWAGIAKRIKARSGYCLAAVPRQGKLAVVVRLASGGINRNTNFCLFECDLPGGAGELPGTGDEGCR